MDVVASVSSTVSSPVFSFLSYRKITTNDAQLLLDWRTAPHIAPYMLTNVVYDIAQQEKWIEQSNQRVDYDHRIIQIHRQDVGFASITVMNAQSSIGELGVYIGDVGVAREMSVYNFVGTLNHAFFTMKLHKIVNHVVAWNDRTLKLQEFNGYRHVGVLKDHALKGDTRHDLHIFEQSAATWRQFRRKFRDNRDWDGVDVGE